MKVFVEPTGTFSRAMLRVADALARHSPSNISFTSRLSDADLVILHVIGKDAIDYARRLLAMGKHYAVVQYCGGSDNGWEDLWPNAAAIWSYYDLSKIASLPQFVHGPLGLDAPFRQTPPSPTRDRLIITSGYTHGPGCEAIEEVWRAADETGFAVAHLGPNTVEGTTYRPKRFEVMNGVSDQQLAQMYHRAQWVSGLRYVEGFELPAAEGLACGARPILFDHLSTWYGPWGYYVTEDNLLSDLCRVMDGPWQPVGEEEWKRVVTRFDWQPPCTEFWDMVISKLSIGVAVSA